MSYAEADTLRRAMSGKARSREAMLALEDKFFAGACERGLGESDAREVWRQMASFAGYSFCKGHSAAFAVLSYQVSYLKTHFPAEFTAGLINNQGGFYGPGPYLEEGRRWGLEIYPPCVQNSDEECTGQTMALDPWSTMEPFLRPPQIHEPHLDPRIPPPRPTIGWVRLGLQLISGLRRGTPARIVAERNSQGPFRDLADFLQRTAILPEETHRLIDAGALDTLLDPQRHHHPGAVRPTLHFEASRLHRALAAVPSTPDLLTPLGNPGLQGIPSGTTPGPGTLSPEKGPATPGQAPPWTVLETCQREMAVLGFMAGAHPLDFTGPLPPPRRGALPLVPARLIRLANGKTVRMIGWLIAAKILATKTTGQPMKMLTLEDRTDTFEATLFPRVYARYAPRTLTRGPYLVEGTVDMSLGSPVLTVRHLELLPLMEPDIQVE
jgi:DNA polymerase III alpha subunit